MATKGGGALFHLLRLELRRERYGRWGTRRIRGCRPCCLWEMVTREERVDGALLSRVSVSRGRRRGLREEGVFLWFRTCYNMVRM
jgi:hypothetical protein